MENDNVPLFPVKENMSISVRDEVILCNSCALLRTEIKQLRLKVRVVELEKKRLERNMLKEIGELQESFGKSF